MTAATLLVKPEPFVCDSCLDALIDYSGDTLEDATRAELKNLARAWGGDIADHFCEARPEGDGSCVCGCKRHYYGGTR